MLIIHAQLCFPLHPPSISPSHHPPVNPSLAISVSMLVSIYLLFAAGFIALEQTVRGKFDWSIHLFTIIAQAPVWLFTLLPTTFILVDAFHFTAGNESGLLLLGSAALEGLVFSLVAAALAVRYAVSPKGIAEESSGDVGSRIPKAMIFVGPLTAVASARFIVLGKLLWQVARVVARISTDREESGERTHLLQ